MATKSVKFTNILKSTLCLGSAFYIAADDDIQRRQKIFFRSLGLFTSVMFQDENNIQLSQEQEAQKLYTLLSEAGGTFVKLGQMIATNTYLFPDAYVKACFPLLDQCPTTNFQVIRHQIEDELGQPIEKVFKYIDEKPVASASLAQVHRGILWNGDEVAIKIQHKKVKENSYNDIRMVRFGLNILNKYFGQDYRWLANDIYESMIKELDFKLETENAERVKQMFIDNPNIYVPKIYHEYTSEKLIVMEFVKGYKITEKDKLERDNLDKFRISEVLNECFAEQVFEHGFVHCDPHPGNILVRPIQQKYYTNWLMGWQAEYTEPQIILLDHGIYRTIPLDNRLMFAKMWKGIILADEQSNNEVAKILKVDMNDLYYPNGSRELDDMPRVKLLKSMMSFKCFEAENADEVFSKDKINNMTEDQLQNQKMCYDYAKRLHKVVANILCEQEDRNLFFLFKNNLYIRNIDIELGHEINNVDITLDHSLKLLEEHSDESKSYFYYASKYIAKSIIGMAKYFY